MNCIKNPNGNEHEFLQVPADCLYIGQPNSLMCIHCGVLSAEDESDQAGVSFIVEPDDEP